MNSNFMIGSPTPTKRYAVVVHGSPRCLDERILASTPWNVHLAALHHVQLSRSAERYKRSNPCSEGSSKWKNDNRTTEESWVTHKSRERSLNEQFLPRILADACQLPTKDLLASPSFTGCKPGPSICLSDLISVT
jgi:hypothetical protein